MAQDGWRSVTNRDNSVRLFGARDQPERLLLHGRTRFIAPANKIGQFSPWLDGSVGRDFEMGSQNMQLRSALAVKRFRNR